MKLELRPSTLSPETLPTYLSMARDRAATDAAFQALAQMRKLLNNMTAADLHRAAAAIPDGRTWLGGLADEVRALAEVITSKRDQAEAMLAADAAVRKRLDVAAFGLMSAAVEAGRQQRAAGDFAKKTADGLRSSLADAGLSAEEIARIVGGRQGVSDAETHIAEAEAAAARAAALSAFLGDPLRSLAPLGQPLIDELEQAAAARAVLTDSMHGLAIRVDHRTATATLDTSSQASHAVAA